MKGFKKDGKFIPTGNKKKSSLKKSDVRRKKTVTNFMDLEKIDPRITIERDPDFIGAPTKEQTEHFNAQKRRKQSLDEYSSSEYSEQLEKLQEEFPDMMESIAKQKGCDYKDGNFVFKGTNTKLETVCGASTTKLFLKLPSLGFGYDSFKIEGGTYQGDGLMENEPNRGHQWIKLDDGTIIDGSHGQFKDEVNHPDDRLEIITSDDPRQEDYVAQYEQNPFTQQPTYYTNYDEIKKKLRPLDAS